MYAYKNIWKCTYVQKNKNKIKSSVKWNYKGSSDSWRLKQVWTCSKTVKLTDFCMQSTYMYYRNYTANCTIALSKTSKVLEKGELQQQGKLICTQLPFKPSPLVLGLDSPCKSSLVLKKLHCKLQCRHKPKAHRFLSIKRSMGKPWVTTTHRIAKPCYPVI